MKREWQWSPDGLIFVPRIYGGASGVIQSSVSVAANTQVEDVLVNNILATSRQGNSVVSSGIVASATGLLVTLFNGTNMIAPEFAPSIANRFPINPDDFTMPQFGLLGSDRLMMRVRNTTGGALTLFWSFVFQHVS